MNIQQAIESLLKFNVEKSQNKKNQSIYELTSQTIFSTKYRKSKVDEKTRSSINRKIYDTITDKKIIKLAVLMGGFKQDRLESSPEPDWAEIYNIKFFLDIAHKLLSNYEYGVEITYFGNEFAIPKLNNYKKQDISLYTNKFKQILNEYNHIIDDRIKIDYCTDYHFNTDTFFTDKVTPVLEEYKSKFDKFEPQLKEQLIQKSYRNQKWNGIENLEHLSNKEKLKYSEEKYILNWAFVDQYMINTKSLRDNYINISFRKGLPNVLHYGSCSSSSVQFWAGSGVFNSVKKVIHPWILSYEQYVSSVNRIQSLPMKNSFFNKLGYKNVKLLT